MKKIKKKIKGYLKNTTEKIYEEINTNSIIEKNKIKYINNDIKHTIIQQQNQITLIRECKEFKNILTFSKNRSILSEYTVNQNNLTIEISVKTLELIQTQNSIYIKYIIEDNKDSIFEYKISTED